MRNITRKAWMWVAVLTLALAPLWATAEVAHVRFRSVQDIDWAIGFSDDELNADGQAYHQDLAQASLGMALSAFRVPDVLLAQRGDNIRGYLGALGFSGLSLEQYDIEPTIQTIASAIGMKNLTDAQGAYTVLAVAISGGGYQDEWKSNFLIGNGLHHEGFNHAAELVYDRLVGYIASHGTLGRIKLWIAGYSRAAATANRLAAMVLDNQLVPANNLFAYTFATPNVTRQPDAGDYPAIFNIVGAFDPVPMIPFDEWGFTRFGVTRFLPTPEADSDYVSRVKPVKALYREMTGVDYWTNQSGNRLIQSLFGMVSDMVSGTEDYTRHYQSLLIDLWGKKSDPFSLLSGLVGTLTSDGTLWDQLSAQGGKLLSIFSNAAGERVLQETGLFKSEWSGTASLGENLLHEHYPKGYLAWLCAYSNLNAMVSGNLAYRQVSIGGDVGIAVYEQDGSLACGFDVKNGVISGQKGKSELTVAPNGDAMTVSIPADEAYRVEITAEDTDPLNVIIREGTVGKMAMQSYEAPTRTMALGDVYTCELPAAFYSDGTRYHLAWAGGSEECAPVNQADATSKLELNSTATQIVSENLLTILLVLLILLLQMLFFFTVAVRALRRHRHQRRIRRALPLSAMQTKRHRFRLRRGEHARNAVKIVAFLLLVTSLLIFTEGVLTTVTWYAEWNSIEQTTLLWYVTLTTLPLVFLLVYAAFPAMCCALFALLWPEDDVYALKTGRYYAFFALPFTALLIYYLTASLYAGFQGWLLYCTLAQAVLLPLLIALAYRVVHVEHRKLRLALAQAESAPADIASIPTTVQAQVVAVLPESTDTTATPRQASSSGTAERHTANHDAEG